MAPESNLESIDEILGNISWFHDLTEHHKKDLLEVATDYKYSGAKKEIYDTLFEKWEGVAHFDAKWRRLELLRENGLLSYPYDNTQYPL